MISLDWIWNFELIGFIGGAAMLLTWGFIVKVNSGGIFERSNVWPTLVLAPTGIVLLVIACYLFFASDSWRSQLHVVNETNKPGYVELDGKRFAVAAESWEEITIRSPKEWFSARGFIGDSIVFDTVMGEGAYMSLLGGDKVLEVQEWIYSQNHDETENDDLFYAILQSPGIVKFSEKRMPKIYGFDESAPSSISVENASSDVHAYDLSILTQEQFMNVLIQEAVKLGLDLDSIEKELTVVPVDIDATIIEE
jgi:hypothetical protein